MITFSKTLDPSDYRLFGYYTYLFDSLKDSIPCIVNHFHRRWEYGMALAFLESLGGPEKIKTVLDVGGAGSLFPPIAALCGYNVFLIDPSPCTTLFEEQAKILRLDSFGWSAEEFPSHRLADRYDAIVSISTIEHVPNFAVFFEEILHRAFRAFFITTDFSMDGAQYSPDHLRTYTPRALESMNELALDMGWNESNKPDWRDTGQHVFNYNFASLGGWR